jgi:hypothetical protein
LYLVFSDNRNGTHDVDDPVTNSDVFIVTSANRGDTWTAPSLVDTGAGDQWFPWVDVNPANGNVGVLYHDRGGGNGPTYATALAEGQPGSFAKTVLSTAPSNPTMSEYFQAGDPSCELRDLDGHARPVSVHAGPVPPVHLLRAQVAGAGRRPLRAASAPPTKALPNL